MIRYKFTKAEYAFYTLFDRRMKASKPIEFNDIFEFCPVSDPRSLVRKAMSDPNQARHLYELELKNGYTGSFEDFKAADLEQKLEAHLPSVDLGKKDLGAREEASKYIGVICLSRSSLVYLLWSHYADSHKGCAIGVDVRHCSFERARVNQAVVYDTQRPKYTWDLEGSAGLEQMRMMTVTKSKVWEHEGEYRLAFPVEELVQRGPHYFVALHPMAVRRIIFGDQMDEEFKRRIDDLLDHPEFQHVFRYQVKRDPQTYSLRIVRLR